jgi:hypothetical protein
MTRCLENNESQNNRVHAVIPYVTDLHSWAGCVSRLRERLVYLLRYFQLNKSVLRHTKHQIPEGVGGSSVVDRCCFTSSAPEQLQHAEPKTRVSEEQQSGPEQAKRWAS